MALGKGSSPQEPGCCLQVSSDAGVRLAAGATPPRATAHYGGSLVSCKVTSKRRTFFDEESKVFHSVRK